MSSYPQAALANAEGMAAFFAAAPWPYFSQDEIDSVNAVLRSGKVNYWTGDEGRQFETEFAKHSHTKYAVALANGTVALELALCILNIGPGDEVVVPSRTFVATASCVVMRGARPVVCDVDRISQNLTVETVQRVITPRTKAIIAVHLSGWPCDMDPLMEFAHARGIRVIEDCAQSHGATYKGRPVGSIADVGAFSFCQDKIMTTAGEGGMLTTNDEAHWRAAWSYKDHGKDYDRVYHTSHPPGFRWLHGSFGTNWRMTEVQAAVGRVQLRKLGQWVAARKALSRQLEEAFQEIPGLRVTLPPAEIGHSFYKYYVFLRPERLRAGWDRQRILEGIMSCGVPCFSGSCSEIYLESAFSPQLRPSERLPVARELGETSLMFQVHPTLTREHMDSIVEVTRQVMKQATS